MHSSTSTTMNLATISVFTMLACLAQRTSATPALAQRTFRLAATKPFSIPRCANNGLHCRCSKAASASAPVALCPRPDPPPSFTTPSTTSATCALALCDAPFHCDCDGAFMCRVAASREMAWACLRPPTAPPLLSEGSRTAEDRFVAHNDSCECEKRRRPKLAAYALSVVRVFRSDDSSPSICHWDDAFWA